MTNKAGFFTYYVNILKDSDGDLVTGEEEAIYTSKEDAWFAAAKAIYYCGYEYVATASTSGEDASNADEVEEVAHIMSNASDTGAEPYADTWYAWLEFTPPTERCHKDCSSFHEKRGS